MDCEGGRFQNPSGEAISAENINVEGHVFLRDGFRAEGTVTMHGATIGGGLHCRRGMFSTLNLNTATVKGIFLWSGVQVHACTRLELKNASVDTIEDDEVSWPANGNLSLDGFTYVHISSGPKDAETRIKWLDRQDQFTLQPYRQLAKVLRDNGDERGARRVLFEMEDRRRNEEDQGWLDRFWSRLLRRTIGYGQMSWWALAWLLVLTLTGSVLFELGYLGGTVAPNDKDAYQCFEQHGYPPAYYPHFNALAYSLEHSFPLVNLGLKEKWAPDMGDPSEAAALQWTVFRAKYDLAFGEFHLLWVSFPALLRVWLWAQIILGWVLATLFVAGLTGIVKSGS